MHSEDKNCRKASGIDLAMLSTATDCDIFIQSDVPFKLGFQQFQRLYLTLVQIRTDA